MTTSTFLKRIRLLERFRGLAGRALTIGITLSTAACAAGAVVEPPATTASQEDIYRTLYPYYAEICAASQLRKNPGFGAEISSGVGGHAVLYLNRVCRKGDVAYPVLVMCDQTRDPADGVGLSVNASYKNANWVATEGRNFFFNGDLPPGKPLTRDAYRATLAKAKAKGIYKGVTFHDEVYDEMPPGFTREDYKYERSVSTDYALDFGRNRYCARVPLSRAEMVTIVKFLNDQNEPYQNGTAEFDWNLFTHNCAHMNHNALAAAHIWNEWETDRFILFALFSFPVPKNEFVNLMRRTNDLPIDDLDALYGDDAARRLLLQDGRLPTQPGALADLGTIPPLNDVYNTKSRIIFLDEQITGPYLGYFDAILQQPRYYRLQDNLAYFAGLYAKITANRQPVETYLARHPGMSPEKQADFRRFYTAYFDYIGHQTKEVARTIARLDSLPPDGGVLIGDQTAPVPAKHG